MEQLRSYLTRWRELDPRRRIVVWALLLGLVVGKFNIALPLDQGLQAARNIYFSRPASGDIVIVGIDDRSVTETEQFPWPRWRHAELVDKLLQAGAAQVYFDLNLRAPTAEREDARFEKSLKQSEGRVVLATSRSVYWGAGATTDVTPLPRFARHAEVADIFLPTNFLNQADRVQVFRWVAGRPIPAVSYALAGQPPMTSTSFPISYIVRANSIPYVSAYQVFSGRFDRSAIRGKRVIIGIASQTLGDMLSTPGQGRLSRVFAQVLGAETLKRGRIVQVGWLLPLVLAALVSLYFATSPRVKRSSSFFVTAGVMLVVAPMALEYFNVFVSSGPALVAMIVAGVSLGWRQIRQKDVARTYANLVSGLPNLNALRAENGDHEGGLVVARLSNYAQIIASLRESAEPRLVEQVVSRLAIGGAPKVYQGDEGLFVWFVSAKDLGGISGQLDALHALFRGAVEIDGRSIDITLTFGVVAPDGRSITNRLSSAIVAADEAYFEGVRWKAFDPQNLVDAEWRLSLLGQLDAAIERGDIWVAYQPKLELATNRIIGAEALVRWSHPEKGTISPDEFIAAAEQHGRIDRLTDYVLETAIRGAAGVNAIGVQFGISVNISPRSLDSDRLVDSVQRYLGRYRFPAEKLTLEVTETAAIGDEEAAIVALNKLRAVGVRVSIDDFGTGHSTLEYLKSLPANEIKIDRSFVSQLNNDEADRLLVTSTVQLARSLGRTVVAEGVEDAKTLAVLRELGCEQAQGYLIGKPMKLVQLMQLYPDGEFNSGTRVNAC